MPKNILGAAVAAAGSLLIALACFFLLHGNATIAALLLLLGTLAASIYASRTQAITASIVSTLCLDYLFIPPIFKITIADMQGWIVLAIFLVVSLIATNLSSSLRTQRDELAFHQDESEKLNALNRAILLHQTGHDLRRMLVNKSIELFCFDEAALFEIASGEIVWSKSNGALSEPDLRKAALYSSIQQTSDTTYLPITLGNKIFGSFAFSGAALPVALLQSFGSTMAVGLAQTEAQEAASRAEAVRKSEEIKSVIIDALAHELKTPLTSIEAAAGMLHEGRVSPEQRADLVNVVREECQRLRRLMNEAIHLARIEATRFKLNREPAAIDSLVNSAIEALGPRATSTHPVKLHVPSPTPIVSVDAELISELLKQLLDNALKYSPAGKPILVSASEENALVTLTVSDEGQGLTELEQRHVFDKFYRARRDHAGVQGTGMGLAIAREIAEAHGGSIRVESQIGKGSRFTVTLQAAQVPA